MFKFTGKQWLTFILAGTIALSLYVFFKKTPPELYWGKGSRQIYSFLYKETSDEWTVDSQKQSRKIFLNGRLNLRIFEVSNTIKAGLQFSKMSLLVDGTGYKNLNKIYTTIFLVEFNKNGEIISFHFSNEVAHEDEKNISAIIKLLQLVIKKSITSAWTTGEYDTLGKYHADYKYENGVIHKKKIHYSLIVNNDGIHEKSYNTTVRESKIEASYGRPVSWIKKIAVLERISIFSDNDTYTTTDLALYMRETKLKPEKNLFIWKYRGTYDKLIRIWKNKEKNTISFSQLLKLQKK